MPKKASFLTRQMDQISPTDRAEVEEQARQIVDANRLARLREDLGLTQAQVAELLAVKQSAISQIESRGNPRLATLRRYVQALGGSLEVRVRVPRHRDVVLTSD